MYYIHKTVKLVVGHVHTLIWLISHPPIEVRGTSFGGRHPIGGCPTIGVFPREYTLLDHLVRYGSNQSLCVASRRLRHNLDQNKPMYTCVRPHCNFKQLWRNIKRSHNHHLYSKFMISLAGNSKVIEKLLTLWSKFLANCFLQSQDDK